MKDFIHVPVSINLRAPRIAIVVPKFDAWQYYACTVLERVSRIWGGAGFILVPHKGGIVEPHLLRMVSAYDPDHVVTIDALRADLMELNPDHYPTNNENGTRMTTSEVRGLFPEVHSPLSLLDERASEQVAKACTPFRSFESDEAAGHRVSRRLERSSTKIEVTRGSPTDSRTFENLDLSARNVRTRDIAVLRASRSGNTKGFALPPDEADPGIDQLSSVALELLGLGNSGYRSSSFSWANQGRWEQSLPCLVPVIRRQGMPQYFVVVGDGFDDFALAHTLDRLSGTALWLPESWLSPQSEFHPIVARVLSELFHYQHTTAARVRVLSVTGDTPELLDTLKAIRDIVWDPQNDGSWLTAVDLKDIDYRKLGEGFLALRKDYDRDLVLPAIENQDKSIEFVNQIPPLVPDTHEVLEDSSREWIVDFDVHGCQMPRGYGLRGDLLEIHDSVWSERVRSGKNGIAIMSWSFGFVSSAATLRQSLARPRLRTLGLLEWVTHQAAVKGWTVSISDAGQRAAAAARLWRGRENLADDLLTFRSFFIEFQTNNGVRSDKRYPLNDGIVVGSEGFLTFEAAVRTLVPTGMVELEVRNSLDRFLEKEVLRRGLILRCLECRELQWIALSELGLTGKCHRCQADIPIKQVTWRDPVGEPKWYYDLHPIIRDLLAQEGDVSVLAGRALQKEFPGGEVIPEVDFKKEGIVIEMDLVFGSPRFIAIGECKTTSSIPAGQRKKKLNNLATVAGILDVDRVILASGEPGAWSDSHKSDLETQLRYIDFANGYVPQVEVLSGLRSHPPLG